MNSHSNSVSVLIWIARVLKVVCILFLVFDSFMKIMKFPVSVKSTTQLGIPDSFVQPAGIYLLIVTVLYAIPRTAVTGCFLLAAYLGGAAAITMRAQLDGHPYIFPIVFAILCILAEYLRNATLRGIIPLQFNS